MPKKPFEVLITTMELELTLTLDPQSTGRMLFDQVAKIIGLREIWYFGLDFVDDKGFTTWLLLNKKILLQVGSKHGNPLKFRFRVRYYPEDVGDELIQDFTIMLFFLQVKNSILEDEVYCSLDAALLLSSYALQVKYGDFVPEDYKPGFLVNGQLLPHRVMDQHRLSRDECEKKITVLYKERKGLLREEAMMEYLKLAQNLEMYGVNYFDIENKKCTQLTLGTHACGIHVYERSDKLTPKVRYPWVEIRNISFNERKLTIKPVDKKAPDVIFIAAHKRVNKTIVNLSMGNHDLSVKRRMADTIGVQIMKNQAREERMAKKQARGGK